jgi:DNA-binding beta-propeller fold protein YncE
LFYPSSGIAIDPRDRSIYVSDLLRPAILKFLPNGTMTVFAGGTREGTTDGPRTAALFNSPEGLTLHEDGTLFITDRGNNLIRRISSSANVSTLAGSGLRAMSNGVGSRASFNYPFGLVLSEDGLIFVSKDTNIRKIEIATENVTQLAGAHVWSTSYGYRDGLGTEAIFYQPIGVAIQYTSQNLGDRLNNLL